jgi:hypothetical protein
LTSGAIPGAQIFERVTEKTTNVKPMIEKIDWLSAADRKKIFKDNARAVFKLAVQ